MHLILEISFILISIGSSRSGILQTSSPGLGTHLGWFRHHTSDTWEKQQATFLTQFAGPVSFLSTRMNEKRFLKQSFPPASSGPSRHGNK